MGVFYLLFYLLGALVVTVGTSHLIDAVLEGEAWTSTLQTLGVGAGLIAGAGLLHSLVERRRADGGVLGLLPELGPRAWAASAGLYFLSIAAGWVQFELFIEPVDMFPFATVLAAAAFVFGLCSRWMKSWRFRWAATTSTVAFVGLPIGLLGVMLPLHHMNHHLTPVRFSLTNPNTHETKDFVFPGDDPSPPAPELKLGDETQELLEAFASARTIDVEEELAAGRMRRLEDGSYVVVNEDGTESRLEMAAPGELEGVVKRAFEADAEAALREREAARAAWEIEMMKRKRGGRLFSSPES